jgi:hypothetical protein
MRRNTHDEHEQFSIPVEHNSVYEGVIKIPYESPCVLRTTARSTAKAKANCIAQYALLKNMSTAGMFRAISAMGQQFEIDVHPVQ